MEPYYEMAHESDLISPGYLLLFRKRLSGRKTRERLLFEGDKRRRLGQLSLEIALHPVFRKKKRSGVIILLKSFPVIGKLLFARGWVGGWGGPFLKPCVFSVKSNLLEEEEEGGGYSIKPDHRLLNGST